jgi:hypothetical protein
MMHAQIAKIAYFCANFKTMKKVLSLLLLVLMAFAGCQRGPVMYQMAEKPNEVAVNAEKFVKQTAKHAKHYTAEEWQVAVEQFIAMSKNCYEFKNEMSQEELDRFTAARLDFMKAIQKNGNDELARAIKEAFNSIEGGR